MLRMFRVLALLSLCAVAAQASHPADVVLYNGKVFTVDQGRPWAEAVAIRGSRIVAVGSDSWALSFAGPETRAVDLEGRLVVPGFNDAHTHLAAGLPRVSLPPIAIPGPGPTLAEALDQVALGVSLAEPGEWVVVTIGEATLFDPSANRLALDPIAPDNPVLMLTWSSHSAVVNSAMLQAAGLAENEPDPFAGSYGRFPGTDTLDGVVNEYALFRLFRTFRETVPDDLFRAQFEGIMAQLVQLGITSVQEMTIGLPDARRESVLASADLSLRLRSICVPLTPNERCRARFGTPFSRVRSGGIKWLTDGTPVERSAALREPYADAPGSGVLNLLPNQLDRVIRKSFRGPHWGQQILFHGVGDRAIDEVLDALDRAAPDPIIRIRRPRIEHGDLLQPERWAQARRLGVIVVQNPTHLALDLEPALGFARAEAAQPLQSLLDAGVKIALGSDGPFPNPFVDLFFAVTHPFHPTEALTMEQAVTAYTLGSAAAEFQDWQKGKIRPGYLADLAVLSQDLFTIPPPAVLGTTSLLTVVGGEVVWDAGVLPPAP